MVKKGPTTGQYMSLVFPTKLFRRTVFGTWFWLQSVSPCRTIFVLPFPFRSFEPLPSSGQQCEQNKQQLWSELILIHYYQVYPNRTSFVLSFPCRSFEPLPSSRQHKTGICWRKSSSSGKDFEELQMQPSVSTSTQTKQGYPTMTFGGSCCFSCQI